MEKIPVLDHGYVRLVDVMGDDLSVVNAARVSFDKESTEFNEKDAKLIKYLAVHKHTSPFRHATLSFEIYAPLLVARQWWKHVVGAPFIDTGWNESSRRYVTEEPTFHVPEEWRSAPENRKQGSGPPIDEELGETLTKDLLQVQNEAISRYEGALARGVAVEQARLFLPAYSMYVRWRWTPSLHAALHFVDLRIDDGAQWEIQQYAIAIKGFLDTTFPISTTAYLWGDGHE